MSESFFDKFDEINGFYISYNNKKYTYNNLYDKIIKMKKV